MISLPPESHRSDVSLTFSGANSNDPDGQLVEYVWDFGDGTTDNGVTVTHTYREPGRYTVSLVVTDNTEARSQDAEQLIILAADEEPVITLPPSSTSSPIRVNATSSSGAPVPYPQPSATDDVDGRIVPVCNPPSGSIFPIGDTTVTCTATDSSGNTAVPKSFTITVVEQQQVPPENRRPIATPNTPPIITGPSTPIEVQATSDAGVEVSYAVTGSDREDGNMTPQCDPPSGSIFRVGETIVRCNIRDTAGSVVNKEFPVIVRQNVATPFGLPLLFIVILVIVAVAVVAVIIILIWRRRIRKSRTDLDDEGTRVY